MAFSLSHLASLLEGAPGTLVATVLALAIATALTLLRWRSIYTYLFGPREIRIKQLWIYPIKSCAGYRVREAEVDALGLVGDRRFVLIDRTGRFVDPRVGNGRMVLLHPRYDNDGALIVELHRASNEANDTPELAPLRVPIGSPTVPIEVRVTGDIANGHVFTAPEISAWFGRALPQVDGGVRLVTTARAAVHGGLAPSGPSEEITRPTRRAPAPDDDKAPPSRRVPSGFNESAYAFSNKSNVHVIGLESIDQLRSMVKRMDLGRVPPNFVVQRFRANVLTRGARPFDEDTWRRIVVPSALATSASTAQSVASPALEFFATAPCGRCSFTSIDPTTGVKDELQQPVRALREFRHTSLTGWRSSDTTVLGMNLVHRYTPGAVLREGDIWSVQERAPELRSDEQLAAAAAPEK